MDEPLMTPMKKISTVGVVGAGTMGAALAQKFAQEGFSVVLLDRSKTLVDRGLQAIAATLNEGVTRKLFSPEQVSGIIDRIRGTESIGDLGSCDLVIEAIFEDLQAKLDLFGELNSVVRTDAILATNTSSFSVNEIAHGVKRPERFCGLHYFYHAAKNRLVEIIPCSSTSDETIRALERFCFLTGKDPIFCNDRYGFAVNRYFVPWLNEAVRLLQEGVATIPEIDAVCMRVFGIGMGPFALMNATGVPIAYHSQKTLESLGALYAVADRLKEQAELRQPWDAGDVGDAAPVAAAEEAIRDRMLGIVFLVCGQILDEGVCTPIDLNRGARIGLKWRSGPVDLMKACGRDEVDRLVRAIATRYQTPFPRGIHAAFEVMEYVTLRRAGRNSIVTISRPEDLNALNETVVEQLGEKFSLALADTDTDTIVITGTGKAFVAGADIALFVNHIRKGTIGEIVEFTARTHEIFDRIDNSPKTVIALLNGLTLGGGLELALCADRIYATPSASLAFPETGIGIYPGLGGTQRTQHRVGRGLTKYLIYTGDMISSAAAADMGLIDGVITFDDYFAIREGLSADDISVRTSDATDSRWRAIGTFFESHSLESFFADGNERTDFGSEEVERWRRRMKQKAPIALRTAERLVDEQRGCASELEFLPDVFGSNDALLGLSSVGRKVVFNGN